MIIKYLIAAKDNISSEEHVYPIYEMEIAFMEAERHSRQSDFRICNATRRGYLEAFERVDFDSLFPDKNNQ